MPASTTIRMSARPGSTQVNVAAGVASVTGAAYSASGTSVKPAPGAVAIAAAAGAAKAIVQPKGGLVTVTAAAYLAGTQTYASLQAAIDSVAAGGTLNLTGLTFTTNATINKALTIIGGTLNYSGTGAGLTITANNVTVQGMTLNGPGAGTYHQNNSAIRVVGTKVARLTGIVIDTNTITGWGACGVDAFYTTGQDIKGNTITTVAYCGVEVHSALNGYVRNNTITDVGIGDPYGAVSPSGQYNAYGITCTRDSGSDDQSNGVTVSGNTVDNVPNWHGLDTHAGIAIAWTSNIVTRTNRGLFITGDGFGGVSSSNTVNSNAFSNPTRYPGTSYGYNQRAITIISGTTGTTGTGNTADGYPFGEGISGNTGTNTISAPTETHGY